MRVVNLDTSRLLDAYQFWIRIGKGWRKDSVRDLNTHILWYRCATVLLPHPGPIAFRYGNWEQIYAEGLEADLPAVKDDPVEDFVNACERLNPEFHQYWSNRLEDPDIGNNMDLHKIIDAFRIFRKRTTKRDANKEISLASFQGQTLEKEMDSKTSTEYTEPRKFRKDCPCGKKHFFKDCFYVNERIRPENWNPEPEIEKNFEKACENPRFKAGYENARKRFSKKDEG